MGKRTNFPRVERDFYRTPLHAVTPLIPILWGMGVTEFAEPCCGEGDLIRHLEDAGRLKCTEYGDIATGQNALHHGRFNVEVITNPPLRRPEDKPRTKRLLIDLIDHFLKTAPAFWLLLHGDWAFDVKAAGYMEKCSHIVVVGRVKWINGSPSSGMENFAWLRFSDSHEGDPVFLNRRVVKPRRSRKRQPVRPSVEDGNAVALSSMMDELGVLS
jgi:hypothetical protein